MIHPSKKRDMSLSQTYVLAHTARAKLSREAARADHELRLLVGHANMLDNLMVELAEAEKEREAWFNHNIRSRASSAASTTPIAPAPVSAGSKRIQWLDTVVSHRETLSDDDDDDDDNEEWDVSSDSDSDDSSDYETDGDFFVNVTAKHTSYPAPPAAAATELYPIKYTSATTTTATSHVYAQADFDLDLAAEYDEGDYDDYDDGDELALTRTSSRQHQPPELLHDSDEESEDDMLPLSPPQPTFDTFSASRESEEETLVTASASKESTGKGIDADTPTPRLSEAEQSSFVEEGFFLPPRNPARTQAMIAAY
ncbi:uncharacterized protein GIQ15_02325 [Arthroderma uncinatum]|uniref:uncharacterized protein n=1 Tax=Arthroderma uncinatum TaxID=74035 RepID=UPI00144AB04A|nr:uncharacterized protein GIQ15_02325 [Arthroderma uncinatum]KAF3483001.1 hypothetical protein GIQ15_02325 [Arthroderma uncinatum]